MVFNAFQCERDFLTQRKKLVGPQRVSVGTEKLKFLAVSRQMSSY